MKFYIFRAFILISFTKFLSALLQVDYPPIVSVTALIEKDGKLLFLNLSYLNGLGLPGGIIQKGEKIEHALKREIKEETGLNIKMARFFTSSYSRFHGIPTLAVVFLVSGEGKLKSSEEGKIVWMDPRKALKNLAYKDNAYTIRDYLRSNPRRK